MSQKARFKGDLQVDGRILDKHGDPIGGAAPGVGDKYAVFGEVTVAPSGAEVLLVPGQNPQISEQQGDSITVDSNGRFVVAEGIYAMSLVVLGRPDANLGDATQLYARLSDYDTPSWGPIVHAAVGAGGDIRCEASGSWAFPEGDTLNFYFGHNATSPKVIDYNLWIIKIA